MHYFYTALLLVDTVYDHPTGVNDFFFFILLLYHLEPFPGIYSSRVRDTRGCCTN